MKRYRHFWWPLKGQYRPSRLAVVTIDTELSPAVDGNGALDERVKCWQLHTAELRGGRRVGGAVLYGLPATRLWQALAALCGRREKTWVFFPRAGWSLGLLGFWDELESGRWELKGRDWRADRGPGNTGEDKSSGLLVAEDPPFIAVVGPPGSQGRAVLLDTRNWGLGESEGNHECGTRATRYLNGLCSILSCVQTHQLGSLRATAAGQAVCSLRTKWDTARLHCHTDKRVLLLERSALYGGRCEALRIGNIPGPVYHLDVRNMYPALCRTLPIPVALRSYTDDPGTAETLCRIHSGDCVADVGIRSTVPAYPCRRWGLTVYPVGQYRATLCGGELTAAIENDHITRWYSAARYSTGRVLEPFYAWWLVRLEEARRAGDQLVCQWIKAVMNGLTGKFAEPGRRWVACPQLKERGPFAQWHQLTKWGELVRHRNIHWITQREETSGESYWSMPAVTAFITGAGRATLWHYMATAGRQSVWYVDTDSLITNYDGYQRLLSGGLIRDGEPGYLRLLSRHHRCVVHGIRHYELDDTITCAGVPKGDIWPGESRHDYWHRPALGAAAWNGGSGDGKRSLMHLPQPEVYRHGGVAADGLVTPFEVDDGR